MAYLCSAIHGIHSVRVRKKVNNRYFIGKNFPHSGRGDTEMWLSYYHSRSCKFQMSFRGSARTDKLLLPQSVNRLLMSLTTSCASPRLSHLKTTVNRSFSSGGCKELCRKRVNSPIYKCKLMLRTEFFFHLYDPFSNVPMVRSENDAAIK